MNAQWVNVESLECNFDRLPPTEVRAFSNLPLCKASIFVRFSLSVCTSFWTFWLRKHEHTLEHGVSRKQKTHKIRTWSSGMSSLTTQSGSKNSVQFLRWHVISFPNAGVAVLVISHSDSLHSKRIQSTPYSAATKAHKISVTPKTGIFQERSATFCGSSDLAHLNVLNSSRALFFHLERNRREREGEGEGERERERERER